MWSLGVLLIDSKWRRRVDKLRDQVYGILELVACGGSHEINHDETLDAFSPEVIPQDNGTLVLVRDGVKYRVSVDPC